jgi:adenosine kinase
MMERKIGRGAEELTDEVELLVITYGEEGSELRRGGKSVRVHAAKVEQVADPTGAGDAYRAGLLKGLLLSDDLEIAGKIGSIAAAYAIEHHGTQEHSYTPEEFVARLEEAYPESAGALTPDQFRLTAPVMR